jgi:hypothetical protein
MPRGAPMSGSCECATASGAWLLDHRVVVTLPTIPTMVSQGLPSVPIANCQPIASSPGQ